LRASPALTQQLLLELYKKDSKDFIHERHILSLKNNPLSVNIKSLRQTRADNNVRRMSSNNDVKSLDCREDNDKFMTKIDS